MNSATRMAIEAVLKADATLAPGDRRVLLECLDDAERGTGARPSIVVRPKEAARMLSVHRRTIENLRTRGILKPVRLPGSKNCLGYLREDVERIASTTEEE